MMAALAMVVVSFVAVVAVFLVLQRGEHDESDEPEDGECDGVRRFRSGWLSYWPRATPGPVAGRAGSAFAA